MSNVIRTRHQVYQRQPSRSQYVESASRPVSPSYVAERSIDIYEQQMASYADYHEMCRQALARHLQEDPDRNWNYIDRLQRIWEAGNRPTSVLPPDMRLRLSNNREVNSAIRRLYEQYSQYPARVTDNFETPRRNTSRQRVSFREPHSSSSSISEVTMH